MEWQKGEPSEHGFYIGAVMKTDRTIVVQEVWYNPDAAYNWWTNRGYSGDRRFTRNPLDGALKEGIIAWMPLPEPPEM